MIEKTEPTQFIFNIIPEECIAEPGKTWLSMDIYEADMPPYAKLVLLFLLIQEPTYRLSIDHIKRHLSLGTYSVRQALKFLQKAGYARYERKGRGQSHWFIYSEPQHSAVNVDEPNQIPLS
jgi:hypothetical protein